MGILRRLLKDINIMHDIQCITLQFLKFQPTFLTTEELYKLHRQL